ncbi:MAG: hypothetical protein JKY23_03285, partial [Nitrospinaceae bacterium]|nr:hypothetical protein [Nitrospinaceae bacterium]
AVTDTIFPTLLPGDSVFFIFGTPANLTGAGTYTIDAWTLMVGDAFAINDSSLGFVVVNDSVISTFPYVEDFEAEPTCATACASPCPLIGFWTNAGGDDIDWTVDEGGTPSTITGPSVDNTTGLPTGNYVYTEASGCGSSEARLESPCIDVTSLTSPGLAFFYHMAGTDMGDLFVEVDSGSGYVVIDSISGQQQIIETDPWILRTIPLIGYTGIINIRFRGITGTGFRSDMAIDDIAVYDILPDDVGVIAITAPTSSCYLTATETITIEVVNFGSAPVDTIPVAYTIDGGAPVVDTVYSTILAFDTATFSFTTTGDFSAFAAFTIDSWTAFTGDPNNLNDSTLGVLVFHPAPITAFPYNEDFEAEALCGNGLINCNPDGACPLIGNWQNSTDDDIDWSVNEGGTGSFGTGPAVDHTTGIATGNYLFTEASACAGQVGVLGASCLDISGLANPRLSYWYHMFGADMGNLYVLVDTGAIVVVDSVIGQQQTANGDPWLNRIVDLTPYSGVISIGMVGITGIGTQSDIAIDDLSVFDAPPNDVGVIAITAPSSGCGLTATETITVEVVNFGSASSDTIPIVYTIDGGAPVVDTIFAVILPGDTATASFTVTGDFSATNTYTIDSWTQLVGDTININDSTLGYLVTNLGASISVFPYLEDFETGTLGQFTTSNVIAALDWNNTAIRGTDPGHSNTRSAYFGNPADTTYDTGVTEGSDLTLSCVDFSSLTNVRMSFNYWLITEGGAGNWDVAQVSVSTDGVAFTPIADNKGLANVIVDPSGTWQNLDIDLTAYAGNSTVYIRFSFNTVDDINNALEGFYVDDINIYEPANNDMGVISINAPTSTCDLGTTEPVTITVQNYGLLAQDTIPVAYTLNGGASVIDTIFTNVLPGATQAFTFASTVDLSSAGTYTFDAWTALPGDGYNINDSTLSVVVTNLPVTTFPFFEDFEPEALCVAVCGGICPLTGNWMNGVIDTTDWTTNEGGTASAGTGPTVDHTTGLATGNYVYTEASGLCSPGASANLLSQCLDISSLGNPMVSYWYHMFGADMGILYTEVFNGVSWVTVDSIVGGVQAASGDPWLLDSVDISAFSGVIQIRFRGVTGAGFQSDISLDDITVFDNPVAGNDAAVVLITTPTSHCDDGSNDTITVEVVNLGLAILDTIPVGYSVNGGPAVIDTVFVTLLSGDTTTFTFATGAILSPAGGYSIDAWTNLTGDANNNNDSSNLVITIFPNPTVALGSDTAFCAGGSLLLNTSNFGFVSYAWSTGATDSSITTLVAGTFSLTVTDGNGCSNSDTIVVTVNPAMVLTTAKVDAACGAADGSASVSVAGGTGPYVYLWDDLGAQTTDTATGLVAAIYEVIVTDAVGCLDSATVTVNNIGGPTATISSSTNVSCNGGADGMAIVTLTSGTAPFTYLWDDPATQTTDTASGLVAGTHNVVVTDNAGCVANDAVTLTEPSLLVLTSSNTSSNCGQADGSASVSVSGGVTVYTYSWDDPSSQTNATAISLTAGTYEVIVTDANACLDSVTVIVSDIPGGVSSISASSNASCNGGCDGSATASIAGGTAPFTYLWDDPSAQTNAMTLALCAGTYAVSITDAVGCLDSSSVTITEPAALVLTTDSVDATCGLPNGSASVSVTGGVLPLTYLWNDPAAQTTDTATGLAIGFYNVTVTDAGTCTDNASITVNAIPAMILTTAKTDATCGGSNGSASVSVVSGTAPYTYAWDDPGTQTTDTATGLAAASYTVVVTDNLGCLDSAIISVNDIGGPTVSISPSTNVTCNGGSDGTAIVTVTGGSAPYTYLWDDPGAQTTDTATGLTATIFTVTVTDNATCLATDNITITEPLALSLTGSSTDETCGQGDGTATVSVTGGVVAYTYAWDDPSTQTTATAAGLSGGTYEVIVTDANGCTDSVSVVVTNQLAGVASISVFTNATCNGVCDGTASGLITGGTPPFTFLWDDPGVQNTVMATGLCAGTYEVKITDATGCVDSASVTITEPGAMSLSTSTSDATCGNSDGSASVTVTGGTAPLSYLWDDPATQTNSSASSLVAGAYLVIVTDSAGCLDSSVATVNNIGGPTATISASTNLLCNAAATGSATVGAIGGTTPYTYLWSDLAAQTNAVAVSLTAGLYTVTVTDAAGCISTDFVTLTEPLAISSTTSSTDESCSGSCDGSALVFAGGGTGAFTYLWNDPGAQTTATATALCAATVTVSILDGNGCTRIDSATVNSGTGFTTSVTTSAASCGSADGSATVSITGGTAPFTYLWDDPGTQTNASAVGLAVGVYNVVVTDANGCTDAQVANVNNVGAPVASILSTFNVLCNSGLTGSATASAIGGIGSYTYLWDDGATQTTATAGSLASGAYNVSVTDSLGCTGTASTTITEPTAISSTITKTDASCNGICDGTAQVVVTGGTTPYVYAWTGGLTTSAVTGICAGNLNVTITDNNACLDSGSVTITEPSAMTASTTFTDASCGLTDGTVTVSVTAGNAPYTYLWDDPAAQTNATASNVATGTYIVNVVDSNGCTITASATVGSAAGPSVAVSGTNATCLGCLDGTATATAAGGTTPYTYLWN